MYVKSIAEIMEEYPDPMTKFSNNGTDPSYCVGGALALAHNIAINMGSMPIPCAFPQLEELTNVLQVLNRSLNYESACGLAGEIIACNDNGDFAAAWEIAELALTTIG